MEIAFELQVLPFLAYIAFTIYIIVSIIRNLDIDSKNKIFWVAIIIFFNIIGLIVYLLVKDKNILT